MTVLVILALIVAVAKLWGDVRGLTLRVRAMESGQPLQPWQPDATPTWPQPQPQPDAAPIEPVFTAPAMTARVIRAPTAFPERAVAPEATALRHSGLDPRSRLSPAQGSGVSADDHDYEGSHPAGHSRESGNPSPAPTSIEPREVGPRVREGDEKDAIDAHEKPSEPSLPRSQPTTRTFSFEDIFGRKLPIWAGGITLAVCGFLIVKYSIEAGLISPIVRVIGGLLFGSGLIAGAEAARQNESRVRDPRVAQALSGAGIATLYASILVATNLYHLIPPLVAFLFMAAATVLAGALSIRFGAPSAVLGLVGGLAAPALVGSGNPNVPLLAAYLSLAVGGLATLGRAQRWWWLGVAALAGGFGWGALLILNGALGLAESLSVGAFLLLLGVGLPVLLFGGERGVLVRLGGTLAATAQLAALVASGGFTMLHWGLFGLLGAAAVWLSRREKPLADLPAPALLTALLLMGAWPQPMPGQLAIVFGEAAAIFGLPAAWRTWTTAWRLSDTAAICALAVAPLALALFHFDPHERTAALLALLGAGSTAVVAAAGWRADRTGDIRFALLTGTTAVLLGIAAAFALLGWAVAPAWAVIAAGLVLLARAADDRLVERLGWGAGAATVALLAADVQGSGALAWSSGLAVAQPGWHDAVTWAIPALAALVFARRGRAAAAEPVGHAAAVLLGYVAVAQVLPQSLLPLVPALGVAVLGSFRRSHAATLAAGALALGWAAWPLAQWLAVGGGALLGFWTHADALSTLTDTAAHLLAPGIAAAIVLWRHPPALPQVRHAWLVGLALLGTASVHIAYKQLFAIEEYDRFVTLGLAERTLWEALLVLTAVATWRRLPQVARALGIAAGAHLAWFTLLLHNPLWAKQAVGPLPVANLLLPNYALAFALLWVARRTLPLSPTIERARGWALMLLVGLVAASELRQLVHGSILVDGGLGQAEDIARSIIAIAVAVGFLLWGLRQRSRDWRIASLVVMLGAVLKVFLFDTSGLDGLLRIASFAALGFSLIGIGWLYSRFLPDSGSSDEHPRAPA